MRFVKAIFVSLIVLGSFSHFGFSKGLENNDVAGNEPILTAKAASDSIICTGSFGGPNGYGYTWIDSDTAGGPTYNWIEISTIGTRIQDSQWHSPGAHPLDDGTAGPFPIGFSFPYNHSIFDSVYVGTNGIISFSDTNLTSGGYFYYPAHIPQMIFSNPLVVFWNDLSLDPNACHGGGDVYYWTNSLDTFIVEYKNVKPCSDSVTSDTVTFEIILSKRDSSITFQYQSVATPNTWNSDYYSHYLNRGRFDSSAVIGIQDQTKLVGLQYFNGEKLEPWFTCYNNVPHSGLVVKFKNTVPIEHNLLVFKWPLNDSIFGNLYYDPYFVYYIKEVGDLIDNDTVKVFNIGKYTESNFSVFRLISVKDSLGNSKTIDSASVLISTLLLPYDSCAVAFSTGWQPEARGFYLVTYRVALPTDQFPFDDTACGLLMAERTEFRSKWAHVVPTCDGIIGPGEWDDSTKFDISKFAAPPNRIIGVGEPYYDSLVCFAYVKNDSNHVYFAFDVPKDTNDTQFDNAALYIDDNGDSWFEADSSEGNFYIYNRTDAESDSLHFMAHVSRPGWECLADRIRIEHLITDWEFAIANNNGHQQFEIAIPRGTDPKWELNFTPGESIGVSLVYWDVSGGFYQPAGNVGYWPATSELSYTPCRMAKIYLSKDPWDDVEDISEQEDIPKKYALFQNYPNPFNPQTNIEFLLPKSGQVKIEIFNILGQKVRTLVDQHLKAGHKVVDWDGNDDSSKEVSSGIYFYRIKTPEFSQAKKMVLLR